MKPTVLLLAVWITIAGQSLPQAANATAPYTENFSQSVSNWTNGGGTPASFEAVGGPDGSSYVSTTFSPLNIPFNLPIVMFRAQDEFNSSSHAFEGDWLSSGINRVSMWVWHNAPVPLGFFVRLAPPNNFPGLIGETFKVAPPNTWTKYSYDISRDKLGAYLFTEGPHDFYDTTLSNVGHIQIGFRIPDGFNTDPNTYIVGLDQPSIDAVPVAGDYNGNGVVDAADYVLWRTGGPLQNEVDDPNHVNAQDYVEWRHRFGNTLTIGNGLTANVSVPEPSAIVLLLLAIFIHRLHQSAGKVLSPYRLS